MEIRFNRIGTERKALVTAISEVTGLKAEYMGAPGFSYRVGTYVITKDGAVDIDIRTPIEVISSLLAALSDRGFIPENMPEFSEEGVNGAISPDSGRDLNMPDTMVIELPDEGFSDAAFDNLEKLAAGKAALIRKALGDNLADGAETLPITREDGKVGFPWFRSGIESDVIGAWSAFVGALCATAKKQKRVILKEKPLDEGASEKFTMRCFLLKLGFIGDKYKDARRIILAGLPGDGSHKMNKAKEPSTEAN